VRLILAITLSNGCQVPEPSGDSLGTFEVQSTLVENECGRDAVPAQSSFSYVVDVRDDGPIVYWRRPGAPMVMGLRNGAELEFETRIHHRVPEAGRCILEQRETVRVVVEGSDTDGGADADAGAPEAASLTGTNTIRFSEIDTSACEGLLETEGGVFRALPCAIDYTLTGASTDPF
jgi:hypothetical protein